MLRSKGQHLTEFALCLVAAVAAFVAMQIYVRRSLQARYKAGVSYLFSNIGPAAQTQYEPYYVTSSSTVKYGAQASAPEAWGRSVGPNEEVLGNKRAVDSVVERIGWQKTGSVKDAE